MDIPKDPKLKKFIPDSPVRNWDGAGNMFVVYEEDLDGTKQAACFRVVGHRLVDRHVFPQITAAPKIDIFDGMGYIFGSDHSGGLHDVPIPGWVPIEEGDEEVTLPVTAPWVNWGPPFTPQALAVRMFSGLVVVEGVVKGGGHLDPKNLPILTLPDGYRPASQLMFLAACGRNGVTGWARIYVQTSGVISLVFTEPEPLSSLSLNLTFLAA